jgi:exonuclease III
MVRQRRPDILFHLETKCKKGKMETIRVKLGYTGLFVVDSVGLSSGLALLWKEEQEVEIQNFTRRHINA